MDFAWAALAVTDLLWIGVAFVFGLLSKRIGLPPLVGFLVAGFVLSSYSTIDESLLKKMADLGITLLLFTIGLKVNLKNILQPQVWGVTTLHTLLVTFVITALLALYAYMGVSLFAGLSIENSALIAFALSFSSTVFVVKSMEDKGEMGSLYGRIAIGILIIQDLLAVIFLAASTGKLPSVWSFLLFLLIPLRPVLFKTFDWVGRGELLILYGFILAIGGAEIFELVEMKGDLGALILGVLIAGHSKSGELSKTMLGFKDLFLLGFFLSIGLYGTPNLETLSIALLITLIVSVKGLLFFFLFLKFKLRSRTSLLASITLGNYSEFGLIVIAIGVANGWIDGQWLIIMALSISMSFVISALLSSKAHGIYSRHRTRLKTLQSEQRMPNDHMLDLTQTRIAVIGMGAVGTGAYEQLMQSGKKGVVGIDINAATVENHCNQGRNVIHGDPSDADFWDRVNQSETIELVLLTLPQFESTLSVANMLIESGYKGEIAATAKFADEVEILKSNGVHTVFDMHTEAGAGFASQVISSSESETRKPGPTLDSTS